MPTERQLLVHSLKSLGYIGDLRKGKQSDFEKLLKEHQNASKLGFQYAQWDQQDLQQYMTNRHQQLYRKIKKLVNMITHSYQTHGFLSLCQLWLKYAQKQMLSYLLYLNHAIKISSIKHISDLNNTLQLWIQNSFAADDSVPDTKHRVHEFIAFKLKLAKSQQALIGGCKGYTVDSGLKNKRCLKNPDLKDNLCFWRSIAIALYESSCQGIQQAN
ncbi:hypothetical protein PROFUN_16749, partial [Planoprotostelium fungivorum]